MWFLGLPVFRSRIYFLYLEEPTKSRYSTLVRTVCAHGSKIFWVTNEQMEKMTRQDLPVLPTWPLWWWCCVSALLSSIVLCLGAVRRPAALTVLYEWSNTPTLWFPQHRAKTERRPLWARWTESQLQPACSVTVYTVTPFKICQLHRPRLPKPFGLLFSGVDIPQQHTSVCSQQCGSPVPSVWGATSRWPPGASELLFYCCHGNSQKNFNHISAHQRCF